MQFAKIITSSIRKRFAAEEAQRCDDRSIALPKMGCLLPKGHRGQHASEQILSGGRIQSAWPQKQVRP